MDKNSSFDDQLVRKLAEILNDTHLTEIEYEIGETRIRVARQMSTNPNFHLSSPMPSFSTPQVLETNILGNPASSKNEKDTTQHRGVIKAPMVGTTYASPNPGSAPFIQVGSQVTKGQTLLIIEAMKVMNQIRSPQDGKVLEIFFHEGEPVEYDQLLLIIE